MMFQKNSTDQITHFFFNHKDSESFFCVNSQLFVMDCTYKINWYNLSLLIIYGKTPLNIIYYVIFSIAIAEKEEDYRFHLSELQKLYITFDLFDLDIILTDAEQALMNTIPWVFLKVSNLLCYFHIIKNVMDHVKKEVNLQINKEIKKAIGYWHNIINAKTMNEYFERWTDMWFKYVANLNLLIYIQNTWLSHDY